MYGALVYPDVKERKKMELNHLHSKRTTSGSGLV
uniref:Uncharacterized protein n=1 Tax=Anguilla anguilla TaxID=7936 RepID=A0A0E9W2W7_ANGAN